jgi:hypothetical protein
LCKKTNSNILKRTNPLILYKQKYISAIREKRKAKFIYLFSKTITKTISKKACNSKENKRAQGDISNSHRVKENRPFG